MKKQYTPEEIESKVQLYWDDKRTFEVTEDKSKEKGSNGVDLECSLTYPCRDAGKGIGEGSAI